MGKFNNEQSWDDFEQIVSEQLPATLAWSKMIDLLEAVKPKPFWPALRKIDIEAGRNAVKEWVEQTFIEDGISDDTHCFWVGIAEYVDKNDTKLYGLSIIGYDVEDPDDLDGDEPTFSPEENLIILDDLVDIEQAVDHDDDYAFLDWLLPIAYSAFVLDDLIRTDLDKQNILRFNDSIAMAVGYNGGDYMKLSPIA
jgi:hypothetical protein